MGGPAVAPLRQCVRPGAPTQGRPSCRCLRRGRYGARSRYVLVPCCCRRRYACSLLRSAHAPTRSSVGGAFSTASTDAVRPCVTHRVALQAPAGTGLGVAAPNVRVWRRGGNACRFEVVGAIRRGGNEVGLPQIPPAQLHGRPRLHAHSTDTRRAEAPNIVVQSR